MGWVVSAMPLPLYPQERDKVPNVQEAGWTPGPFWTVRKISPLQGYDPRTVQPVASRYTDRATPAPMKLQIHTIYNLTPKLLTALT
jgi:hypothetical protein